MTVTANPVLSVSNTQLPIATEHPVQPQPQVSVPPVTKQETVDKKKKKKKVSKHINYKGPIYTLVYISCG